MSTIVLFSYSNAETTATTLKLKQPAQPFSDEDSSPEMENNNIPFGDKGFLPSGLYDNTLYSKSFFSLELCTENLGSETGSDTSTPPYSSSISGLNNSRSRIKGNRRKTQTSFPPPLTTMTGASTIEVWRRWEGGRLIIDAVEAPFKNCYLQAERSGGRLRLSFPITPAEAVEDEEEDKGGEMGMEKCQWMSSCKERTHTWKPSFWVITS